MNKYELFTVLRLLSETEPLEISCNGKKDHSQRFYSWVKSGWCETKEETSFDRGINCWMQWGVLVRTRD